MLTLVIWKKGIFGRHYQHLWIIIQCKRKSRVIKLMQTWINQSRVTYHWESDLCAWISLVNTTLNCQHYQKTNNTSAVVGVSVGVSILIILIIAVIIFVTYKKKYRWYPRMSLGFSNAMYRRDIDESY